MKKISVFLLSVYLILAQDYGKSISLFADFKSIEVGQAITVLVMEFSQASNTAKTENKRDDKNSISSSAGTGIFDFIPEFGVANSNKLQFKGEGKTSKSGALKTKMTVKVVDRTASGDLVIEGSRVIQINNEKEVFKITGIVRPADVSSENTVYSYHIYDAQLSYTGKGEVSSAQSKGIISTIIGWIF
jgi:flagellar L-ring protein FlgH